PGIQCLSKLHHDIAHLSHPCVYSLATCKQVNPVHQNLHTFFQAGEFYSVLQYQAPSYISILIPMFVSLFLLDKCNRDCSDDSKSGQTTDHSNNHLYIDNQDAV